MKLIVASEIQSLINYLEKNNYPIVAKVDNVQDLERLFGSTVAVGDTLLITEKVKTRGSLAATILNIHQHFPEVRIIFFANGDLTNPFTVNQLYSLASAGIYDLFYGGKISTDDVEDMLRNPRLKIDCQDIFDAYSTEKVVIKTEKEVRNVTKNNVFAVTSVKPGTGKSFVSSNLAVTLAKYATPVDNRAPKVLLLEGDLQTLSVYTLFGVKDEDFNLKAALKEVTAFIENHSANEWFRGAEDEKNLIRRCCLRTSVENLYVLEGHDFDFNDISECNSAAYYYLLDYLSSYFDYVIVDCNSSFQHPTTDPIFQLAKKIYFVYTTDFNNIKLNIKFLDKIEMFGITDKVRYVLNRTLVGEQKKTFTFQYGDEEIIANKLRIDFRIPLMDMAVVYNSTYNHRQIALDETAKTLPARLQFIRLANDITSLTNLEAIYGEVALLEKEYGKKIKK